MMTLEIKIIHKHELSPEIFQQTNALCSAAFEEDYTPYLNAFEDSLHLLGYENGRLVSHALWITRWLQIGDGPLLCTAYVEGVATAEEGRGRGYATQLMRRLATEIENDAREYDLAALSPFSVAYYARLGWELWMGPLYVRTAQGLVRTLRDGDVMVMRLPDSPEFDVNDSLSVEWREIEVW